MPRKRKTTTGAPAQAVAVAPGGAYGTRQQSVASQQAVPIAGASAAGTPVTPSAADVALAHPAPTGIPLTAPSMRPGEPFTAGLDIGAGPGSESLIGIGSMRSDPITQAAAILNQLGDGADPDTARYRAVLNAVVGNSGAI